MLMDAGVPFGLRNKDRFGEFPPFSASSGARNALLEREQYDPVGCTAFVTANEAEVNVDHRNPIDEALSPWRNQNSTADRLFFLDAPAVQARRSTTTSYWTRFARTAM
jgi:hypothetical protein